MNYSSNIKGLQLKRESVIMNTVESLVFAGFVGAFPYFIVRFFGLQLTPDNSNLKRKFKKRFKLSREKAIYFV